MNRHLASSMVQLLLSAAFLALAASIGASGSLTEAV